MRWFQRHPRLAIGILGIVLIVAGGAAVGFLNLRNLRRIEAIHDRVSDLEQIRALRQRLEISLLDEVRAAVQSGSFLAEDVRLQVENALVLEPELDPESAAGLRRIQSLLSRPGLVTRETLITALELAGSISERETVAQENLLRRVREDGRREVVVGILALLGLAFLAGLAAWLVPKRLLDPLAHLRDQFQGLGAGLFQEVSLEGVDAALVPLFQNYNSLVQRLAELEEERRLRAESLEGEVRAAARALLEQHRVLANAERLAAVGETAAGLAHEIRNPLAGILAALENTRREVSDQALAHRLGLLREEAERVVRLLNNYLAQSRHAPEMAVSTDIGEMVGELLSLLRYQAPPLVALKQEVAEGLSCVLPPGRVRQALLNLVGNALQALDSMPGTVTVRAWKEDGRLQLEVRDDGPGFPEGILEAPGQPFRTGRPSGTGLGLATVHRTATDLSGEMNITNLEEGGASVVLTLPCQTGKDESDRLLT